VQKCDGARDSARDGARDGARWYHDCVTTNERDNGMQGLHGMLQLRQWTNSGREGSECVKLSYALIGRNGS
jgi:hypothetical protein